MLQNKIYIQCPKDQIHIGTQRYRAKKAKSKSNPIDQPVRTARSTVNHYTGKQYFKYCTRDSSVNILLLPDQHHISDVVMWR